MSSAKDYDEITSKTNLDEALVEEKSLIVIKNPKLGNRTVLWIRMGCVLDKLSLAVAAGSVICAAEVHESITKYAKPFAVTAVLMHASYHLLWCPNPLAPYKIAQGPSTWSALKGNDDYTGTVLVKKSPCKKRDFLTTVSCVVATVAAFWNDLKSFNPKEFFEQVKEEITDSEN